MNFSQETLVNNVYRILEERKISISSFETEKLGISQGYLSRLRSTSEKANPMMSIKTLVDIMTHLGVSFEYLLINRDKNPADENRMLDFFNKLIVETENNQIDWMKESWEDLFTPDYDFDPLSLSKNHPIVRVDEVWDEFGENKRLNVQIAAWHFGDDPLYENIKDVTIHDFCSAPLSIIDSTLFLYRVNYVSEQEKVLLDDLIEAYVLHKDGSSFYLYSTASGSKEISSMMQNLYRCASSIANQSRLDSRARNLIDRFNNPS